MKKLLHLLLFISCLITAQEIKLSTKVAGANISTAIPIGKVFNLDVKTPKTKEQQIGKSTITSNTAIYKGITYPVYQTEKGKLFIVYPNKDKTGYSKKYITNKD